MSSLHGKVALVTGGAGGIGASICEALASQGARVAVGFHRSAGPAAELAGRLAAVEGGHAALHVPVTDSAVLATLGDRVAGIFGRLDIVVNCAGTTRFVEHGDLDGLDDALIDDILATNVRGPFAVVRALRPLLARDGGGVVINISSIAATSAMGSNVMYCASKAALDNMTRSLARALAPSIRVLSVAPGLVDTDFVRGMDAAWRDAQCARTPLGRLAAPQDIARTVLAAITHLPFTTGAVIPADGGRPLA